MEKVHLLSDFCRVSYWFLTYGGYAGDLSPKSTFELLTGKENVVLIDVRPEARDCKFFQPFLLWDFCRHDSDNSLNLGITIRFTSCILYYVMKFGASAVLFVVLKFSSDLYLAIPFLMELEISTHCLMDEDNCFTKTSSLTVSIIFRSLYHFSCMVAFFHRITKGCTFPVETWKI